MPYSIPSNYYDILGQIESGNNPFAKNPRSSASGTYQFTRSTWEGLGFNWSDRFNPATQDRAAQIFTQQNANYLTQRGIGLDFGSLYAAHFLGAGTAAKVLKSSNDASLGSLLSPQVLSANPFLKGMNVGSFRDWLSGKTGVNGNSSPSSSGPQFNMETAVDAGQFALAAATGNPIAALAAGADFLGITGGEGGNPIAALTAGADFLGIVGGNPIDGLIEWIKNLFSVNTALRFVFVIIGIILIIGVITVITKADRVIVETVKEAAPIAAIAA